MKKQMESHGLDSKRVEIADDAIRFIADHYTREAGVRALERQIASILRKVAKQVAEGKKDKVLVTKSNVTKFLDRLNLILPALRKKTRLVCQPGLPGQKQVETYYL